MITWSATTAADARHGETAAEVAAWEAAADAALDLAETIRHGEAIAIKVGAASATFYPGFDADGRYDRERTAVLAQELVADVVAERSPA